MTQSKRKPAKDRQIPDLWQIADIPELKGYSLGGEKASDLIRECWHQCHDLQTQVNELVEVLQGILRADDKRCLDNAGNPLLAAAVKALATAKGKTL